MCMFVGTCGVHCIQNMERVTKVQFKIADCTLLNSLKINFLKQRPLKKNQGLTDFCVQFQRLPGCPEAHM